MTERTLRAVALAAATAAATLVLTTPALAWGGRNVSIDTDGGRATGCAAVHVTIDGRSAVKEEVTLSVPGGTPLHLHAPGSGGIRVQGSDGRDFEITACKAARTADALAAISVSASGGKVSASGADDDAMVFFFVRAPRGSTLDLAAVNGPMSLHEVVGNVTLSVANGPLTLRGVAGTVHASAQNGPVSIRDSAGDVKVEVVNGPLTARLSGSGWEGKGLDASTVNGPLTVLVAEGYGSSVRVSGSPHVPFRCRAAACRDARRSWDDEAEDRFVELGSGDPVVRLSTVNGPVAVKDSSPEKDSD